MTHAFEPVARPVSENLNGYRFIRSGNLLTGYLQHLFHLLKVVRKGCSAGYRQSIFRPGRTVVKGFGTGDVSSVLQFAGMRTQIAIGRIDYAFEISETERLADGKRTQNAEPNGRMDHRIGSDLQRVGKTGWNLIRHA